MKIMILLHIISAIAAFGPALVRELLASETVEVIAVDKLTYAGNLQSLQEIADHARFRFVKADICDHTALNELFAATAPDGTCTSGQPL